MASKLEEKIDSLNIYFRRKRSVWFFPFLKQLTKLGITANILSHIKLLIGLLVYCVASIDLKQAVYWFLFAFIFDLFDGALARHQNLANDRGKFIDMFTDYLVHVLIVFALIFQSPLVDLVLFYHLLLLSVLYLIVVLYKNEGKPTDWIIEPIARLSYYKAFALIPIIASIFLGFPWEETNKFLVIGNIAMSLHLVYIYGLFLKKRM